MTAYDIEYKDASFVLVSEDGDSVKANKVVVAAGGASYKATGSTGDGFKMAEHFGHTIAPLKPALVPLRTKERWVKDLQGLALENIRITFYLSGKKLVSEIGELMFTHFGVSGPLVLDMSGDVVLALDKYKELNPDVVTIRVNGGHQNNEIIIDPCSSRHPKDAKSRSKSTIRSKI